MAPFSFSSSNYEHASIERPEGGPLGSAMGRWGHGAAGACPPYQLELATEHLDKAIRAPNPTDPTALQHSSTQSSIRIRT